MRATLFLSSLTGRFLDDNTGKVNRGDDPMSRLYDIIQVLVQSGHSRLDDLMDLSVERIVWIHAEGEALLEESSLRSARAMLEGRIRRLDGPLRRALLDLFGLDRIDGEDLDALIEAHGGFGFGSAEIYTTREKRSRAYQQIGREIMGELPDDSALSFSCGVGQELVCGYLVPMSDRELQQELGKTAYLFVRQAGLSCVGGSYHEGHGRPPFAGLPSMLVCHRDPDTPTTRDRQTMSSEGCILVYEENSAIWSAIYGYALERGEPLVPASVHDLLRKQCGDARIAPPDLHRTRLRCVAAHEWGHEVNKLETTAENDTTGWEIETVYNYWTSEVRAESAMLEMVWLRAGEAERTRIRFWYLISAISKVRNPWSLDKSTHAVSDMLLYAALQAADPAREVRRLFKQVRRVVEAEIKNGNEEIGAAIKELVLHIPAVAELASS